MIQGNSRNKLQDKLSAKPNTAFSVVIMAFSELFCSWGLTIIRNTSNQVSWIWLIFISIRDVFVVHINNRVSHTDGQILS